MFPANSVLLSMSRSCTSLSFALRNATPQYATFFLPSCEGVGCGTSHQGLYTLPVLRSSASERQQTTGGEESVVRTWTISSVHGDDSPLEVAVQAKVGAELGDPVFEEAMVHGKAFGLDGKPVVPYSAASR